MRKPIIFLEFLIILLICLFLCTLGVDSTFFVFRPSTVMSFVSSSASFWSHVKIFIAYFYRYITKLYFCINVVCITNWDLEPANVFNFCLFPVVCANYSSYLFQICACLFFPSSWFHRYTNHSGQNRALFMVLLNHLLAFLFGSSISL